MTDKLREQSIEFAKKHLFECAKEILEWGRTSILCDGKLRELAKTCEAWVRDESYALGVAEAIVKEEALRAALAQQDAQAVPPKVWPDVMLPKPELLVWRGGKLHGAGFSAKQVRKCAKDYALSMLNAAPTPPAQQPLGWLDRKAVECLQGTELNWMPAWNRPFSSDPVPIFLGPPCVKESLTAQPNDASAPVKQEPQQQKQS